ncbi:MAG: TolC family protein [Nannocystaceae bacterium]
MRERPELRAAERRADQAELSLRRERRAALPWPSWAQVNYYAGAVGPAPPVGFGVALELPLLSWNLGAIRSAAARVRERDLESRAEIAAVAGEVEDALGRLRRADARVHALQGELLPRVDAAAQRAAAAADAGALDVLEVLDLEARRIAARRLELAARHERRGAVLDLEAAIGAPLGR